MLQGLLILSVGLIVGYLYGKTKAPTREVIKEVEKPKPSYTIGEYWWNKFGWDKHMRRKETDFPAQKEEFEKYIAGLPNSNPPVNAREEIRTWEHFRKNNSKIR